MTIRVFVLYDFQYGFLRMVHKIYSVVLLSLVLTGCAGRSAMHRESTVAGRAVPKPVMHQMIHKHVKEGATQRADIVATFGYPSSTFKSERGRTVWYYPAMGYQANAKKRHFKLHQNTDSQAVDLVLIYGNESFENTVAQIRIISAHL